MNIIICISLSMLLLIYLRDIMNSTLKYDFTNSKEMRILFLCARTQLNSKMKSELLNLIQSENVNWNYLFDFASYHKLIPLLYWNLKNYSVLIPENVFSILKANFDTIFRKNLLLLSELLKLTKLFENEGLEVIPYKGSVISILAYNNISLREFKDIDLFVKSTDALKIKNLMLLNGYELLHTININDEFYMKFEQEYQFINPKNSIIIEIKWRIEGNFFSLPYSFEVVPTELERINSNNIWINTFSKVDTLLILCIHVAKHDWNRLAWLCDISEFIKSQGINWSKVLENSEKMNIKKILFTTLILCSDLVGLKLPENILKSINSDESALKMSFVIKKRILMNNSITLYGKFILDLNKRDSLRYGFKDCINGLTRPTYLDYSDISLPEYLFYLYFFVRPFLLLKRYGKNSLLK